MTRSLAFATGTVMAAGAAAALLGGACQNLPADGAGASGTIRLALIVQGNVTVSAVDWKVLSASSATLASGTINTSSGSSSPSVSVGVPPGTGDTVSMHATTSGGTSCNGTSAPFNVMAGQAVPVSVTVNCAPIATDGGLGSVVVTGVLVAGDNCPALSAWTIAPQQTAAQGGKIDVSATATDADSGDTLSYAWTATAGSYADAASPSTQYVCGAAGTQTLSVTITDSHTPVPCSITASFPAVDCL